MLAALTLFTTFQRISHVRRSSMSDGESGIPGWSPGCLYTGRGVPGPGPQSFTLRCSKEALRVTDQRFSTTPTARARYQADKVRVAIVGVGNCASSFVQGVEYYKNADPTRTSPV